MSPATTTGYNYWDTEITYLKKVGPKRAEALGKEAGIRVFRDLLYYFPRKYVDKGKIYHVAELHDQIGSATLIGTIHSPNIVKGKRARRLTATFRDATGQLELVWFKGIKWISDSIKEGQQVIIFGQPKFYGRKAQIAHPEMEKVQPGADLIHNRSIVPHYHGTEKLQRSGLDSRGIRDLVHILMDGHEGEIPENLPAAVLDHFSLMPRNLAFKYIHFPESAEHLKAAKRRLKFEEFFFFQLMLAEKKAVRQPKLDAFPFPVVGDYFNKFYEEHIPFELTGAQKRVIKEIRADLSKSVQMNRLVQGDVGSGKTMVAFMCCLIALDNGFQTALMAPTEILAEQHYRSFKGYADQLGVQVALLTGSTKKRERDQLLLELRNGVIQILIGTHALIEDRVQFQNLGMTVVDEQHKFGVLQRAALWSKGRKNPHNMVMTATPIPRTLGMTAYGDLEVSVIDELPPGRTPIITRWKHESKRLEVFGLIRKELEQGRQAYIVYPLVEESEKLHYLAVTEGHEAIKRHFQGYRVGIVHGRQKPADKDYEMQKFKEGHYQILVATTVIEVGVDVPNATMMVIENAEKFGLSQLHQLRGRVGRGGKQSYCLLVTGPKISAEGKQRLKAMTETTDGFKIAELDLKLRGPGDFLGTRQSGMPEFRLANLIEDHEILAQAREAAFRIVEKDPELKREKNRATKIFLERYMQNEGGLAGVL